MDELSAELEKIIFVMLQLCSIFLSISFYFFFPSMKDYQRVHPEVTVLDPPDAIQQLRNRQSMLEVVADLKLPDSYGILCNTVLCAYFFHHMKLSLIVLSAPFSCTMSAIFF